MFEKTSHEPYDRHEYVLVLKNGKKMKSDDYNTIRNMWYKFCMGGACDRIDIVDAPTPKKSGGGGF